MEDYISKHVVQGILCTCVAVTEFYGKIYVAAYCANNKLSAKEGHPKTQLIVQQVSETPRNKSSN
jgi:hypothetical protein